MTNELKKKLYCMFGILLALVWVLPQFTSIFAGLGLNITIAYVIYTILYVIAILFASAQIKKYRLLRTLNTRKIYAIGFAVVIGLFVFEVINFFLIFRPDTYEPIEILYNFLFNGYLSIIPRNIALYLSAVGLWGTYKAKVKGDPNKNTSVSDSNTDIPNRNINHATTKPQNQIQHAPSATTNEPLRKANHMNEEFKPFGMKAWAITDNYLIFGSQKIAYSELDFINLVSTPTTAMTNGVVQASHDGKILNLSFSHADKDRVHYAVEYVENKIDELHGIVKDYKYLLIAHTGTKLEVYDDYVVINFMQTGSITTNIARGGALGGKRIDFENMTSVQFREPNGMTVGFIQFAYPGSIESRGGVIAAINDENSVPVQPKDVALAREIIAFIEKRRKEIKATAYRPAVQQLSSADELKKFKELLDSGVITQEEFDAKKKQLLGL